MRPALPLLAAALLAWIPSSGPAHAQVPKGQAPGRGFLQNLIQLDANGDEAVDREEVPEEGRTAFDGLIDQADENKNGKLEFAELRAATERFRAAGPGAGPGNAQEAEARFRQMDKDGDGKVAKDEFTGPEPMFERLDQNKDGAIDREEGGRAFRAAAGQMIQRIREMDKDDDGAVSREEYTGPDPAFDRLDADKDGRLSREELDRVGRVLGNPAGPIGARIREMDKNADGKVSKDEFAGPEPAFDRLDTNKDGVLSPDDAPSGPGRPAATESPARPITRRLKRADTDGNGQLSRDEFRAVEADLFGWIDADGDGSVTPDELRRAATQLRENLDESAAPAKP
jgi:Ca2+-binding EF-hand superfamily protein